MIYLGCHHKAASSWIARVAGAINQQRPNSFHVEANAHWSRVPKDRVTVHITRDPRDMVVSAYYSHLNSHPVTDDFRRLGPHRARIEKMAVDEGLLEEIRFMGPFFEDMLSWPSEGTFHRIRYDHLFSDDWSDRRFWLSLMAQHGMLNNGIDAAAVCGIVAKNTFTALSGGRRRGEEDQASHFRKGVTGEWRRFLGAMHILELEERYPGLVQRFGCPPTSSTVPTAARSPAPSP